MRRDAQTRRDALIQAAAACFAESGYLVPLEEIADRAGVGRGTLYRNFKDRMAIVLAIFEREVDLLEAKLDRSLPLDRIITDLVLGGASASVLFTRLAAEMPLGPETMAGFMCLGDRFVRLLEPVVDRAHAEGTLRQDVGAVQIFLVVRMISGLLKAHLSQPDMPALVAEALSLVTIGLQPR